jgi:hypothetical protein
MKQVHEPLSPTRNEARDGKVNKASIMFVDLFRRIAADSQMEKINNG